MIQIAIQTQIIVTEDYAVEDEKTARSYVAEVKNVHHSLGGTYALGSYAFGSTQGCT